jgi:two-component system, OmpR family, sensor histidine kinase VicK
MRTEVVNGAENVIDTELKFFFKTQKTLDTCMNYTRPPLAVTIEPIKKAFLDAKNRGVRLRYLTEITKDNISYCKELMQIVDDLRHLNGIKGNFMVSETEYLAPLILYETGKIASQIIYSNVKEIVEQQQYVFDSFWNRAIAAEERYREIEQGIPVHYETKIIENSDDIIKEISHLTESSNELSTCLTSGGMRYSYEHFFQLKKRLLDRQNRGDHKGIRYITNIEEGNVKLARLLLDAGIKIRHVRNLPPMSFGVSDKGIAATIEKMEGGKNVQSLLISNEPTYIKHFSSIFEELWKNGLEAADKIRSIEEGLDADVIDIIHDPFEIQKLGFELLKSAYDEILILFSTSNAFRRQMERAGGLQILKEVSGLARGVRVRILTPMDDLIEKTVEKLRNHDYYYYGHRQEEEEEEEKQQQQQQHKQPQIDIRYIESHLQTKVTILVVDRRFSLVVELKDDTKETSYEAIGLATYSNSKSTVLSYVSIFESLWKQTEMYEQLKVHDRMQKEFINIAAHELRTPIQPILGLSDVLRSKIKDSEQLELLDAVIRNARRLQRLTEDILDVTKIESQSLKINKERVNLNELISSLVDDYRNHIEKECGTIKILYESKNDVFVDADRGRLNQVISNLLSNAIKFTKKEDAIYINVVEVKKQQQVIVSIKDTGIGIDPQILPRLFTKFATKSQSGGTGLGLFISKSIIEAHGGKIWATNNDDGKGATFAFSLPYFSTTNNDPMINRAYQIRTNNQI